MKKRILICGGAGYIGGLTSDMLINKGFDVTVYDNLLYEERYLKPINFIYGDIRETEKLLSVSENYDIIILMAALVGDPACSVDSVLTEEINFKSIKNFCEKISEEKHIIFMSTCSVYGAQEGILDENSPTNPLSSYASTKLESEKCIIDKNGTVFRLGTVFGLGDNYSRLRLDLVVNVLTMKAVKEGVITINGGNQWRPIIAVRDIAGYIVEACERGQRGTYILSKENVLIKDLGERISNLIEGTKINFTEISFQDARNYKVDNKKAINSFKYKPFITVDEEVKKMFNLFKENRVKNLDDYVYHNGQFLTLKKINKQLI